VFDIPDHAFAASFRHIGWGCSTQRGKEATVDLQVNAIMIGVEDLARSKKFYEEGLGCKIDQDHPTFMSFNLGEGSSSLALYEREAAAQDAGVSSEGSGFRGVSFHYIVPSTEDVDEVMRNAMTAGGGVVKEAAASPGGYFGYFSDPDGYLWKVVSASQ
jgi:predicted enzyme related to lactoylglutathione lyase